MQTYVSGEIVINADMLYTGNCQMKTIVMLLMKNKKIDL